MNRLIAFLILLCVSTPAFGQATNRISLTIVVTNVPVTGNNLVVNANTRTWTNASTASTILTNLVSTAGSATNLYNNIASFPYSGGISPRWLTETSIVLYAPLGAALSASQVGAWSILTLSTQSAPNTFTALWPLENIIVASNRTNQGSAFVYGLSQFSTNAFSTNSTATSNYITKGASPEQFITSPLRITGTLRATSQLLATNGFTSGLTNINPVSSNTVNYGNAIRSEGSGGNSLQVGSNAVASGSLSVALGNSALSGGPNSLAIGTGAIATNSSTVAIGVSSLATNSGGTAIGQSAIARGAQATAIGYSSAATGDNGTAVGAGATSRDNGSTFGINSEARSNNAAAFGPAAFASHISALALGSSSSATHSNSTVLGSGATSTGSNQVLLGTSSMWIQSPGIFAGNKHTNTTFTGTNIINGQVVYTPASVTTLANGYNSAVAVNQSYVRYSGPTGAYTNVGFSAANKMDGRRHLLQFSNPGLSFTILHDSGLDSGDTNRIYTGTGALLNSTNNPVFVEIIRDEAVDRWRVISFR